MKQYITNIIFFSLFASLISCHSKDEAAYYFSKSDQDSLLVNIITLVAENAPGANDSTRFQPQFRKYYADKIANFSLDKLEKTENGYYYFMLNRPVGHLTQYRRGVVGKFKLKEGSLRPTSFEEVVNTPHLDIETLKVRGTFLFNELVKNNQLTIYIPLKHYVEWPDSTLKYSTKYNRWESIRSL